MKVYALPLIILLSSQLSAQRSVQFVPTSYYTEYSSVLKPVLTITTGDTVHTSSVDALGFDKDGKKVAPRGNPLTGPFFIQGAKPGDVIAISIHSVKLNRNSATTLNALVPKVQARSTGKKLWRSAKLMKWNLDLEKLMGSPADTALISNHFTIQLHPFIGCVGVASQGPRPANSGASGAYGGNLDSRFISSGATVYLPVYHEGALVYLGDGHAAQGDGELNGDALETSMDFSFSVKVLQHDTFPLQTPMVETAQYLMFFAIEKSLDQSLKLATMHLQKWLSDKYNLSAIEISQVVGPSVEYRIPKIAASKVEVIAMLPKQLLQQLEANISIRR